MLVPNSNHNTSKIDCAPSGFEEQRWPEVLQDRVLVWLNLELQSPLQAGPLGRWTRSKRTLGTVYKKLLVTRFATRNKCIASSNKCLTSSNKKLLVTSASLLVTSALLVITRSY